MKRLLIPILLAGCFAGCNNYGPPSGEKFAELTMGSRPEAAADDLLDPSPRVREWAIIRLARNGDRAATNQIAMMLDPQNEPVPLVRSTAAVGLRILGDPAGLPALTAAMDDKSPLVRADAVETIGDLGGPNQAAALSRSLKQDPDRRVRLQAVRALEKTSGESAVPQLIAALNDTDESVAFAAHQSLITITNQTLPPSRRRWEEWLKAQQAAPAPAAAPSAPAPAAQAPASAAPAAEPAAQTPAAQ